MWGVGAYVEYAGYSYDSLYTQLTDNDLFNYGFTGGFTYADYMAEIDADRAVLVHIEEHTMCGYGYANGNILVYDTWSAGGGSLAWGGSYSGSGVG